MINVGIIGFGRIGAEHAAWLSKAQGTRAVAAFDPTPARRELAKARGLSPLDSLDAICTDPEVHAVLIATPTSMHFDHAMQALDAGKHVMVEKPMALDAASARIMTLRASQQKRVLSVFHNRRWDIDYLTVRRAIESGTFGKLINIESRISQWASCVGPAATEWHPQWRNQAAFGGGGLYDWGSHLLDQMWRMMLPARPMRLFAQLRSSVWSKDCDDFARVCIDFDNGAVGVVEINTTTTCPLPRWHIDGTLGSATAPASPTYDTTEWATLTFAPPDGSSPHRLPAPIKGLSESEIWTQFARAIQGDSKPAVSAESVLPTMHLLDAARISSGSGLAIPIGDCDWRE
jgi:predicted dehydrogenase